MDPFTPRPKRGDEVRVYPLTGGREDEPAENPILWGQEGTVYAVHEWGVLVLLNRGSAVRVTWEEVMLRTTPGSGLNGSQPIVPRNPLPPVPDSTLTVSQARDMGYTGDCCRKCGSVRLRWAGHCQICEDCNDSTECS